MRSDIITIVPTFHKRLKYIPFVEKAIDIYLNINAPRVYISDVEITTISRKTFVSKKKEWAEIILEGIVEAGKQYEFQYVFLLLEDLMPFKEIPASVIDNHLSLMKKYDYKSIAFSTYPKVWMEDSFNSTVIDGVELYEIPHSFKFYSQLQPGIWNKEYLQTILRTLISENKFSPWEFEYFKSDEKHFIAKYPWPNVLGGFIESGEVNIEFVRSINGNKDLVGLKSMLQREYYKALPGQLIKKVFKSK